MKVVLDSNVLVSAFATRGLCADVLRLVLAEHDLVTTEAIVREVTRVLTQKLRVPHATVDEIRAFLESHATATTPTLPVIEVRDPDDAIILGSALAAGADVLVTGDRDLLDLQPLPAGIVIVDPRGFRSLVIRGG